MQRINLFYDRFWFEKMCKECIMNINYHKSKSLIKLEYRAKPFNLKPFGT
jgi:hypothetical protein